MCQATRGEACYYGLDFAVRGWTAALLSYIDTEGRIFHLDEYKVSGETAQVHQEALRPLLEQYAPFARWIGYADPAGFARTQQSALYKPTQAGMLWSLADEYLEAGFAITRANNEVLAGINYVRQLHRTDKIHVHPRNVAYIDEKLSYQWMDQPTTQLGLHSEPEKPRKLNDHVMDGERYELYSKPQPAEEESKVTPGMPIKFELKLEEETGDQVTPIEVPDIYDG